MIQHDRASRPQSISEIKRMLTRRGHDFIEQQKFDELKRRVIPTSELSDPLIDDPIHIVASDWNSDWLILTLNQAPNRSWITTLQNLGAFQSIGSARPRSVSIQGTEARIPAPERIVESAFNFARSWIEQTNTNYANSQRQALRDNEERQRRNLQAAIRQEEESKAARARVLEKLNRQTN